MTEAPNLQRDVDTPPPPPPHIPDLLHPELETPIFGTGRWRRWTMRKLRAFLRRPQSH